MNGSFVAVIGLRTKLDISLDPDEIGKQICPCPTMVAQRGPAIKGKRAPRTATVPFTIEEPPTSLPRGMRTLRPFCSGVVQSFQSNSGAPTGSQLLPPKAKAGVRSASSGKSGPASSKRTRQQGSSETRPAMTPPLEPAPTMTTSNPSMLRMVASGGNVCKPFGAGRKRLA